MVSKYYYKILVHKEKFTNIMGVSLLQKKTNIILEGGLKPLIHPN
jgi:hypothetical protein